MIRSLRCGRSSAARSRHRPPRPAAPGAGVLDPEAEKAATGRDGTKLTDAIAAAGLTDVPRLAMEENRYLGYLEAHIEQGAYLEQAQQHVGVVTAIVGIRAARDRDDDVGIPAAAMLGGIAGIFVHALLYSALFEDPYTWVLAAGLVVLAAMRPRGEATP